MLTSIFQAVKLLGEEHQKIRFIFTHRQGSGFCTISFSFSLICGFLDFTNIDQLLQIFWGPQSSLTTTYIISAQTKQSATLLKSPVIHIHLCSTGISRRCRNWPVCQIYHSGCLCFFYFFMGILSDQMDHRCDWAKDRYSNTALFLNIWHHQFGQQPKKRCSNYPAPW